MKHLFKTLIVGSLLSFALSLGVGAALAKTPVKEADALDTNWVYTTTADTTAANTYWAGVNLTQYGETFRASLQTIMNSNSTGTVSYSANNTILTHSDLNPDGSGTLLGFYDGASLTATWDSGNTWNKEHTWPNSRGAGENTGGPGADPHVLRAEVSTTNESRGNKMYGPSNTTTYDPGGTIAKYRGEAARCIFYAATRYYGTCGTGGSSTGSTPLNLTDDPTEAQTTHNMGMVSKLLEWNNTYPVQPEEIVRNECLYHYDGIRNPFIDHPEYANYIWSSTEADSSTYYQRTSAYNPGGATVDPTSVTVTPATASVAVASSTQLSATVLPTNATNRAVTWSSSNTSIATVSSSGLVTGIATGSCTITATSSANSSLTGTCTVTVTAAQTGSGYKLVKSATEITAGSSFVIGTVATATAGSFLSNETSSTNYLLTTAATPTANGSDYYVTVDGTAIMKFTLGGSSDAYTFLSTNYSSTDNYLTSKTSNSAYIQAASASTTADSYFSIAIDTSTYAATIATTNLTTQRSLRFNPNYPRFAFYASTDMDVVYLYKLSGTVAVTGVSVAPTSLDLLTGSTSQLTATIAPSGATNKTVSWSSNNTGVATVSSSGLVTAVSAGTATITVTTADGGYTATCVVTVTDAITVVSLAAVNAPNLPFGSPTYNPTSSANFIVTATFNNGTTSNVTSTATYPTLASFISTNNMVLGVHNLTVSYTDDQSVTVTTTVAVRTTNVGAVRSASNEVQTVIPSTAIASIATAHSWVNGTAYMSWSLDSHITISATKTTGSNTGKYYSSNSSWRLYQIEGANLVITAATGYSLRSITVVYTVANSGTLTGLASNTATAISGSTVSFAVRNTGSATNGNVQITAISVTYYTGSTVVHFTYQEQATAYRDYLDTFKTCDAAQSEEVARRMALEFNAMDYGYTTHDAKTYFQGLTTTASQYTYQGEAGASPIDYTYADGYTGTGPSDGTINAWTRLQYIIAYWNSHNSGNQIYLYTTDYNAVTDSTGTGTQIQPALLDAAGHIINPSSSQSSLSITLIVVASTGVMTLLLIAGIYVFSRKKRKHV